jgi:hypothetical protein
LSAGRLVEIANHDEQRGRPGRSGVEVAVEGPGVLVVAQVEAEDDDGPFEALERRGVRLDALTGAVGGDDLVGAALERVVVEPEHGELLVAHALLALQPVRDGSCLRDHVVGGARHEAHRRSVGGDAVQLDVTEAGGERRDLWGVAEVLLELVVDVEQLRQGRVGTEQVLLVVLERVDAPVALREPGHRQRPVLTQVLRLVDDDDVELAAGELRGEMERELVVVPVAERRTVGRFDEWPSVLVAGVVADERAEVLDDDAAGRIGADRVSERTLRAHEQLTQSVAQVLGERDVPGGQQHA